MKVSFNVVEPAKWAAKLYFQPLADLVAHLRHLISPPRTSQVHWNVSMNPEFVPRAEATLAYGANERLTLSFLIFRLASVAGEVPPEAGTGRRVIQVSSRTILSDGTVLVPMALEYVLSEHDRTVSIVDVRRLETSDIRHVDAKYGAESLGRSQQVSLVGA